MNRLASLDELGSFRQRVMSERSFRENQTTLTVSAGTCGQASGANDIIRVIKRYIIERNLRDRIALRITGCQGFCELEPFILVEPGRHLYPKLTMEQVPRVIESAVNRFIDKSLIYHDPRDGTPYLDQDDIPFFRKQTRVLMSANEKLDPIRILAYIENDGYAALEKVLVQNDPQRVIDEVKLSGIRGRGGAGFPTGIKWERAAKAGNGRGEKYIVCNADEGDPGAYMDRSLLEGNPHAILEGMMIAAFAIGATAGLIYVRSEYPLAIKHALIAIDQARALGLLGVDVLGTGRSFDINIVRGAGAFVCGEETALIRSVEGYMGEPRQRPPYPIQRGINGRPTCINNVETLANIPVIINGGGEAFARIGVAGNTGTKIFSLVGKIKNTGLVEVPLGIPIKQVVFDIGGGPVNGGQIKAVQTGGPSGGCIPASMFDLPISYDSLTKAGSIMGSGGMIVMDQNTCMVDVAKYFMNFLQDESCGKCYTCRKGTQRMWEILDDITRGKATMADLDLLEELATVVKDTTMCGLGQSAANPVLSTIRYFRREYERHINDKRCDAFVCRELVGAPCQTACPLNTRAWEYVAHIARGEYEKAYFVIREANPFPSVCARVCHHPCESRCRAGLSGGDPVAIRNLKRFITDRIDPASYKPARLTWPGVPVPRVAVVGSGPTGLTAAHYLSLLGVKVTVFESEDKPGGMLTCVIPSYRLPREAVEKEIESLIDDNVEIKCGMALGSQISVDSLMNDGYGAILLAMGAHESRPLQIENEDVDGVYPSIRFLKAFNIEKRSLAKGWVGVIGGGNSALDAARMALRQKDVSGVTILYRRTRDEMPAFAEEIEAADQEGIQIRTLVSPVRIVSKEGRVVGLECLRNQLGEPDSSGRRRPVPIDGSNFVVNLDTVIVAIGEDSGVDCIGPAHSSGIETTETHTVRVDAHTMTTNRRGVFAAGDVVTGPNTVVDAIAAGKRAAEMIRRFLLGLDLKAPYAEPNIPRNYVEPPAVEAGFVADESRVETPRASVEWRKRNFAEVEVSLSIEEAFREAHRCLRCDLEFTRPKKEEPEQTPAAVGGGATV